jgi:hypothetical protein
VAGRYLSNHSLEGVLDQEMEENKDREKARKLNGAWAVDDRVDELHPFDMMVPVY